MRARVSMQNEKLETVQDFHQEVRNSSVSQNEVAVACHHLEHFQVVADFKSQIARLEMEKEDLERELSKKVGIYIAFIFYFLDAFAQCCWGLLRMTWSLFNLSLLVLFWCWEKKIGTQSLGEVKSLTINISYSSQISAGHGAQLALQFNGKVSRRDMD